MSKQLLSGIGHLGHFLKGKSALVTGSTSGTGLAIARSLASHGASLVLNGKETRTDSKVEALIRDINIEFGVDVHYHEADMSNGGDAARLVNFTVATYERIDVLVNNVSCVHVAPIEEYSDRQWKRILDLNLSAAFHTTKTALPFMTEHGFGRVINVASVLGLVGTPQISGYVATKHGLIGLTKSSALEMTRYPDVTVNAVCPGFVETKLLNELLTQEQQGRVESEAVKSNESISFENTQSNGNSTYNPNNPSRFKVFESGNPTGEFVDPDKLGNLCVFLCSPYATEITGQAIVMDGGYMAQ